MNGLKDEALTSANTLIQNHSGQEWNDHESRVRHGGPKMPYHLGGAKLEPPIASSYSLPPSLPHGGGNRKTGVKQKGRVAKYRGDNDSITTWEETLEM